MCWAELEIVSFFLMVFMRSPKPVLEALKICATYSLYWHFNWYTPVKLYLFLTFWLVDSNVRTAHIGFENNSDFYSFETICGTFCLIAIKSKSIPFFLFPRYEYDFILKDVLYNFFLLHGNAYFPCCSLGNEWHFFQGTDRNVWYYGAGSFLFSECKVSQ